MYELFLGFDTPLILTRYNKPFKRASHKVASENKARLKAAK